MILLLRWLLFAVSIMFIAWLVPGIEVSGLPAALFVAVIIALINIFIRPIIQVITLPINVITLGIFGLVINALLFWFAGYVTPGFEVEGFWSAILGSVVLSFLGLIINRIADDDD